ncbi:MAG: hypothetical protein ABSB41_06835 [Anaerolineales bacterium]|jgi:hypothetical protein
MKKEVQELIAAADRLVCESAQLIYDLQRKKGVNPDKLRIGLYRYELARRKFKGDLPPLVRSSPDISLVALERASSVRLDRLLPGAEKGKNPFSTDFETLADLIWNIADMGLDCYDENSPTDPGIHVRYCSPGANFLSSQIIPRKDFAILSNAMDRLQFNWKACLRGPAREYVANGFYK